ncbi:MAG: STAS domain-containing protein [Fibrobacter sp.]|nr:STAS domain-containing protein [Fibrobacter sp.]
MNIGKTLNGNELVVTVTGRIDTATSQDFENSLNDSLQGIRSVLFDFEKLEYISSAGLRILLSMHKKFMALGGIVIKSPNDVVSEVLEVTGFKDILNII